MKDNVKRVFYVRYVAHPCYLDIIAQRPEIRLDKLENETADDVARPIPQHLVDRVLTQVHVQLPMGRTVATRIEKRNPLQVVQNVGAERRINRHPRGQTGIHLFLQQSSVKMTRIGDDELRLHRLSKRLPRLSFGPDQVSKSVR